MSQPKILHAELGYSLQVGDQVSKEFQYGEPITLEVEGKVYFTLIDLDDEGEPCTPLDSLVYCGVAVEAEEVETAEEEDVEEKQGR